MRSVPATSRCGLAIDGKVSAKQAARRRERSRGEPAHRLAGPVWDTIGAGAAGWQAALILREGNAPLGVGPQPDYIGKDLDAVADQLITRYPATANAGQ